MLAALHYSIERGDLDISMDLIKLGADVNQKDSRGYSSLMNLCISERYTSPVLLHLLIMWIVELGAIFVKTVLHCAFCSAANTRYTLSVKISVPAFGNRTILRQVNTVFLGIC